jgi:phosphatidylglycerophosphate synthase
VTQKASVSSDGMVMRKSSASLAIARLEYRPLLRSALVAILAPTLVAVTLSAWAGHGLGLSPSFPAHLLGLLGLGGILILYGLPAHGPHHVFGAANHATVARGVLVAFLAALLVERVDERVELVALGTASLAAVMDAVDGWLARRMRMDSAFGARFDMETDALFILVLSLWAWHLDKAGPWVIAGGLLRYLFLLGAALVPALRAPLPERFRRKAIAASQMITLLVVICPFVPARASAALAGAALLALSISFLIDTQWLLARSRAHRVSLGVNA